MTRRADPARIDDTRKAATRNRLIGDGVPEATADESIAAWHLHAAHDGLQRGSAYWEAAWKWIAEGRVRREQTGDRDRLA